MAQTTLIKALQQPEIYPHPVVSFEVIETHLSWVILTGTFAYKIKKSVNFGFQDFTTLEKRKSYCEKEIRLNHRLAPDLYLQVIPITGTLQAPILNGKGKIIEYAIQMYQFSQDLLLSNLAKTRQLTLSTIDNLATQLAVFHQHAEPCNTALPFGSPEFVYAPMQDNFRVLRSMTSSQPYKEIIDNIESWSLSEFSKHHEIFLHRKKEAFIRACHGDLHLGNMVLMKENPFIFDCIEFNESFRWIDVMNDIGFLTMDLDHFSLEAFHAYFLNKYLEHTHDYQGLLTLRLYQSYRAMVRAKIMGIEIHSNVTSSHLKEELEKFILLAKKYIKTSRPSLTITFGLSGSGKTYKTQERLMKTGAIRLRSDVFRQRLMPSLKNKYSQATTELVYHELVKTSEMLLKQNYSVIIDATCLKKWQRDLFFSLASSLQVPFHILPCDAPIALLRKRITERASKNDASDATQNVLEWQIKEIEPLEKSEESHIEK